MKSSLRAVVAAIACLAVLTFVPQAGAVGTFEVTPNACNGWGGYASNGWGNGIYCNGYAAFQLNSGGGVTVGGPGTFMWRKSPRLPDATFLKTLKLSYLSSQATGSADHIQARACQRYAGQNDAWSGGPNGACVGAVFRLPSQNAFTVLTLGEGTLACATNCGGFQIDVSTSYSSGFVWIDGITATIGDNTAPAVSSLFASHAISQGNWLRGDAEIGATGTDSNGSGIASMAFYPGDPTLSVTTAANCDFSQWIPCAASKGWTGSFDTTTVNDGPHTGYYTATDPAGRVGQSSSFDYKVDNTNPTTPISIDPTTNGLNGWSSTNSIGASWANGAEVDEDATHSGLDKVIVDVAPTTGSQTDPAPITVPIGGSASGVSATKTSISGLALPAVGAWTVRLQLVDKAGNVSDVGDGSGNSVDSDISVGYDPNPPATPLGQANGWISRDELAAGYDQDFTYTSNPTSVAPLCGFASTVDEDQSGTAGTTINVPGGTTRKVRIPGTLTEATHYVHLRAVACNGMASPSTNTTEAKVDRTDPEGTISGVQNGHWYKDGKIVTLHATDALSGMAPADPGDPFSTGGAYLSYALNENGPADKNAPRGDNVELPVTGEGQKTLSFRPVDLAGNKANPIVSSFGIDATKPTGYINHQDAARPTLLTAPISDPVSGIEYAVFYVRLAGSRDPWKPLPTSMVDNNGDTVGGNPTSTTASARFPDTDLKDGTYNVRVAALDQAGNELATDRYQDGTVVTVANPMRDASKINARLFKALRSCGKKHCAVRKCTKKTKGTCYRVLKGRVTLVGGSTTVAVAFNRGAILNGVLSDANNRPLANQTVTISTVEKVSGKKAILGTTKTDSNGIYGLRVPAGLSRTVVATYPGTETRENVDVSTSMGSQAKLKLKISKRHAMTGQTVTFSGRVTSYDGSIPAAGKIVALQFYALKKWRPAVAVAHTDGKGNFKIKYKFDGKKVRAKIIFRVSAPAEDAWGHVASVSKPTVIRLN